MTGSLRKNFVANDVQSLCQSLLPNFQKVPTKDQIKDWKKASCADATLLAGNMVEKMMTLAADNDYKAASPLVRAYAAYLIVNSPKTGKEEKRRAQLLFGGHIERAVTPTYYPAQAGTHTAYALYRIALDNSLVYGANSKPFAEDMPLIEPLLDIENSMCRKYAPTAPLHVFIDAANGAIQRGLMGLDSTALVDSLPDLTDRAINHLYFGKQTVGPERTLQLITGISRKVGEAASVVPQLAKSMKDVVEKGDALRTNLQTTQGPNPSAQPS